MLSRIRPPLQQKERGVILNPLPPAYLRPFSFQLLASDIHTGTHTWCFSSFANLFSPSRSLFDTQQANLRSTKISIVQRIPAQRAPLQQPREFKASCPVALGRCSAAGVGDARKPRAEWHIYMYVGHVVLAVLLAVN